MNRDGKSDFTIGIEEEYLLVDPATGALADDRYRRLHADQGGTWQVGCASPQRG
jgi:hypothetical protein